MALKINLPRPELVKAIQAQMKSTARANAKETSPIIIDIRNKEIAMYQEALNSLTEIK